MLPSSMCKTKVINIRMEYRKKEERSNLYVAGLARMLYDLRTERVK